MESGRGIGPRQSSAGGRPCTSCDEGLRHFAAKAPSCSVIYVYDNIHRKMSKLNGFLTCIQNQIIQHRKKF